MVPLNQILVVEDNPGDFILLKEQLFLINPPPKEVIHVASLGEAKERLEHGTFDAVFLDLGLPDSQGLQSLEQLSSWYVDQGPIIVATGLDDQKTGLQAVEKGAQDFICKRDYINEHMVQRSLLYAVERNRADRIQRISKECLKQMANGEKFGLIFDNLITKIDHLFRGIHTAFLQVQPDLVSLQCISAPNLPKSWRRVIDGSRISALSLPCGRAAFEKKRVVVENLNQWLDSRPRIADIAQKLNIKACWAEPIQMDDSVLGVFAFFIAEERKPFSEELNLIESLRDLALALLKHQNNQNNLERSEARFRALYQQGADSVLIYDESLIVRDANAAAENLFGYSSEEMIGMSISELNPLGLLGHNSAITMHRLKKGETVRFETNRKHKNGTDFPVQISSSIVRSNDEVLIMEICRDISALRQSESNLKHANDSLKSIRDINRLIIHEKSRRELIRGAVETLVQKHGLYHAWIVLLEEDGSVYASAEKSKYQLKNPLEKTLQSGQLPNCMQAANSKGGFYCVEAPQERCNGCPVKKAGVEHGAYSNPLQFKGTLYGYLSAAMAPEEVLSTDEQDLFREIAEDLSFALHSIRIDHEGKAQELKYRLLAENSTDCIWMLSSDYEVLYTNPTIRSVLGYSESQFVGKNLLKFAPEHSIPIIRKAFETSADPEAESNAQVFEAEFQHKNGNWVPCEVAVKALKDQNGNPTGLQGSMREIAERKKAEKELLEAKSEAEHANAAKDDFLAIMSHEMRTPLNPIMGLTQIMLEECENEEHLSYLNSIYESANRELELVNNILSYTKLDKGTIKPSIEAFSLVELCEQVVSDAKFSALGVEVQFINPSRPDVQKISNEFTVKGAKNLIHRVLSNLIGNGCKYTREGFVHLTVDIIEGSSTKQIIHFGIKDSGIGIDSKKMGRLFSPFEQIDTSLTREFEGAGLGLAICKKIVTFLDGEIGVKSELNKGSYFWFTLPLESVSKERVKPETKVSEWPVGLTSNVLLVEDRECNALIAQAIFKKHGIRWWRANNGKSGVEMCKERQYDLILMDLAMPIMDGIEATRLIRKETGFNQNVPIYAMTADVSEERREECYAVGMQGIIEKPLERDKLLQVLKSSATKSRNPINQALLQY